ncbi:MAG: hypothetical protein VX000_05075, partial [Myxococcota bacterium]|nr:hypothetical protein [Myxococcota bacterium]
MLRPIPPLPLRPATSGLGLGLFGCGALVVAGRVVGPSPRSLAFMLGAVIAGCWVGGLFPARRLPRATPLAAGALALGGSVLVESGARALGAGLDWIGASAGMLAPAIAGGAFLSAVGLGWLSRGVPAAHAVTLAGAAAGIAVGALLGPAPSLTLGAAALAWRRDSSIAGRAGPGWVLLPVGTAAVLLLSALQPSTSPSPGGALAFALGAIGSGTMFALLPMREERAVWWGLFSLAVTAAAPVLLPELTAEMAPLALGASPARGRVLLLLPLVIGGTAIGPALAALLPARHGPLALAAGLAGGALMPLGVTAGTVAAVGAGLVALGTAPPLTRAIAAALVAGLLASDWQGWVGDPAALGTGVHRTVRSAEAWDREQKVRPGLVDVVSEVGVLGASVVRAPLAWTETQGQRGRPDRWAHHVEQQGTISTSIGREAEA